MKEIEQQQKALEEQAEKIKAEINADMIAKGESEIKAGQFIVRLKEIITSRFDSKTFAKEHKSLYEAYTKSQTIIRFTVI